MSAEERDQPRAIQLDVEVPGAAERVWDAIATGPGITSWFVPATVEQRNGGRISLRFGPGMEEAGEVTVWDRPRQFAYAGFGDPRGLTYEFRVDPHDDGTCTVRLVNGGFGSGGEWDADYELMEVGWRLFLHNLRLYLRHFPGQDCSSLMLSGYAQGQASAVWDVLRAALDLAAPQVGERATLSGAGAVNLSGTVERVADGMLTLLVDDPAPAIASVAAEGTGDEVFVSLYVYVFGEDPEAVTARLEPGWQSWMQQRFPPPMPEGDINGAA